LKKAGENFIFEPVFTGGECRMAEAFPARQGALTQEYFVYFKESNVVWREKARTGGVSRL